MVQLAFGERDRIPVEDFLVHVRQMHVTQWLAQIQVAATYTKENQ